ncbi:efflux transporter, RND family, MFP subunit [Methylobacterium sp. 4-46]|uniref:MdtA/MuxA family multidrug efflux RND transporter periplasmic adaptor subunit n=1 Tax=unclassified Methylobacterium TaxID=2615210 RepID=UPI000152D088|nr:MULTISPECIES: MdtA/MuxA family multidrug efflux RND transporter periplasmic adaptor subunit [Methylobacterium]ACA18757.1 efflux transporter, RND family, MFP subunit [Methylobacterium sp. 4-46]WFT77987.1 MdtA/MuxA family multidrug efflux RND transporter periplasmic adaptor subunit [Methylobacterium nodulans]
MNELSPIRTDDAVEAGSRRRRRWPFWLLVLLALAGGGVWAFRDSLPNGFQFQVKQAAKPEMGRRGGRRFAGGDGPQAVGVATVVTGEMPVVLSGLGTVTPLATVTVRSQVSGYLTRIGFREGQHVREGDFLAQIDVRPYEALLAQYQGQLQRDQALLQNARLDLTRYQTLNRQDSISKQNVDTQAATVKQYEGVVASDQAQIDQQKLNIQYGRITAPVDGRVGLRQIDQGNYVTAASTSIVVVTQLQPISVLFTLPEDVLARVMARLRGGAKLPVRIFDRSDTAEIASGMLDTVDNQIDVTTGTVKLRALFPNADDRLFPNQFVNAKLLVDTVRDAPVIPAAAVLRGTPGTFVYLLGEDGKVSVRPITVGETDGNRTVVTSGLKPGDQVVVDGTDRLRDGAEVKVAARAAPEARAGGAEPAARPAAEPAAGEARPRAEAEAPPAEGERPHRRRRPPTP